MGVMLKEFIVEREILKRKLVFLTEKYMSKENIIAYKFYVIKKHFYESINMCLNSVPNCWGLNIIIHFFCCYNLPNPCKSN